MNDMIITLLNYFGVNMNKNVILILVDQMRGDCIGINGNSNIMTPFLDDLAKDGINFTNAHAANPSCVPARASILTGLPSHRNGFFGYCDGVEWEYSNTMVDKFNELNFKTINVGKTHFYNQRKDMNFSVNRLYDPIRIDEGFESDYHIWLKDLNPTIEDPAMKFDNNGWPLFEWPGPSYYHPTEWTMRTAIEELEKINDDNFFMQISFHRPHPPFDPPKFYYDLYDGMKIAPPIFGKWSKSNQLQQTTVHGQYGKIDDKYIRLAKRGYYASITHIDYQVGKLVEYLKQNKLYDETTIIFTSDHGEMLGDHAMFRKATPFRGSIHIPFILKNGIAHNVFDNRLATHIDIMPTVLSSVDQEYNTSNHVGIDLNGPQIREALVGEHPFDKGWNYVVNDKYKYIWDSLSGQEWCFDLKLDISECNNIIDQISEEEQTILRQQLVESFKSRGLKDFIKDNKLKTGKILPAYDRSFNECAGHNTRTI